MSMKPTCENPLPAWMVRHRHEMKVQRASSSSVLVTLLAKEHRLSCYYPAERMDDEQVMLLRDLVVVKQQGAGGEGEIRGLFDGSESCNALESDACAQAKAIKTIATHGNGQSKETIDAALAYIGLSNNNAVQALCTYPLGRSMVEATRSYRATMDKVSGEVANIQQSLNAIGRALAGCKKASKDKGQCTFDDIEKVAEVMTSFSRQLRGLDIDGQVLASNLADAQLEHIHSRSHDVVQLIFAGVHILGLPMRTSREAWRDCAADLATISSMMAIYTRATKGGAEDLLRERISVDQHACF